MPNTDCITSYKTAKKFTSIFIGLLNGSKKVCLNWGNQNKHFRVINIESDCQEGAARKCLVNQVTSGCFFFFFLISRKSQSMLSSKVRAFQYVLRIYFLLSLQLEVPLTHIHFAFKTNTTTGFFINTTHTKRRRMKTF